jgi:hypothetical protein
MLFKGTFLVSLRETFFIISFSEVCTKRTEAQLSLR